MNFVTLETQTLSLCSISLDYHRDNKVFSATCLVDHAHGVMRLHCAAKSRYAAFNGLGQQLNAAMKALVSFAVSVDRRPLEQAAEGAHQLILKHIDNIGEPCTKGVPDCVLLLDARQAAVLA